jgi:hypothetical protein
MVFLFFQDNKPVVVKINMHINTIYAVNEVQMVNYFETAHFPTKNFFLIQNRDFF